MGIIAWIVLGLAAGLIARMLIPGRDAHGLVVTAVIGVGGALLGGFLATRLFDVDGIQGFFNLSTWITAVAGAAVLLLAHHMVEGRNRGGRSRQRSGRRSGRRTARR
ncbi:GlsB/YeaQ/YmgE family stress response membrane protein [Wenjunlia tyrosinilytica]|uniref:Transglycosylase n=1 Tax=Wenjunlia tyrosinilytica TaxID=1544741 RepID=A0A917ZZQ1_9ACTN|nr:GlsB/YeaQ/YmgE family stress response membrane protein [Wenjunlia tyrosinilytica]GGP00398.1 transglycosylase [Wenjunlia tyrosinilytica]